MYGHIILAYLYRIAYKILISLEVLFSHLKHSGNYMYHLV
jgi:hypothetical protein